MKKIISLLLLVALLLAGCSQAKEPEVVNTISTDRMTYYELSDGTWQADGKIYKYRLEIPGQLPNSIEESTFVYLSNIEKITFDKAWKAAGFSSQTSDYFSEDEAILVEWKIRSASAVDENRDVVAKPDSKLDAAISNAILSHNSDKFPDGMLVTESHIFLADDTAENSQERTVLVYYLNLQFNVDDSQPAENKGIFEYAIITFTVDDAGEYVLKDYREPHSSSDYDQEVFAKYAPVIEAAAEHEEEYATQLLTGCWKIAGEYVENKEASFTAQPGNSTKENISTEGTKDNTLTLDILKSLVEQYGEELTWAHFEQYNGEQLPTDLYTIRYSVEPDCYLDVIGDLEKQPTAILLGSKQNTDRIDVRTNNIDDFINDIQTS